MGMCRLDENERLDPSCDPIGICINPILRPAKGGQLIQ
jgi:hypothetical protein